LVIATVVEIVDRILGRCVRKHATVLAVKPREEELFLTFILFEDLADVGKLVRIVLGVKRHQATPNSKAHV
jgi:hypothetical protein